MIPRMQAYMDSRIPLNIRKRGDIIYFQIQYDIAREDGLRAGDYSEYSKISANVSASEVGDAIKELLDRYHKKADMLPENEEFIEIIDWSEYVSTESEDGMAFLGAKDIKDLDLNYLNCFIKYSIQTQTYEFGLAWIKKNGNKYYHESSNSLGDKKVMTFDTPLVFDDNVEPEVLGAMLFEAFERCQMLTDRALGEFYARKEIDLLDESKLTYEEPRDKHFADFEDGGVAEIYQIYSYLPSEDAESSCDIYLGIASEIDCNIEEENVKTFWEKYYGKAKDFVYEECKKGIFTHRVELKNSKAHKISYLLKQDEELVLECSYVLHQPSRRKKLNEKLQEVFEKFVISCKFGD